MEIKELFGRFLEKGVLPGQAITTEVEIKDSSDASFNQKFKRH